MLKVLVSLVLGPWGLKVLDFYIRNSAIINSIVFLYGVILVSAHVNYKKIVGDWLTLIEENKKKKSRKKTYHIDWEKEISKHSSFPLITGNTSLIPKKTSPENLLFYLAKDRKWKKAVDGLKINE